MAQQAETTAEVIKNCPACKKPLKRSRRYYRNGQYYCNKNCWKTKTTASSDQEGA